jgi:hypothetical protein
MIAIWIDYSLNLDKDQCEVVSIVRKENLKVLYEYCFLYEGIYFHIYLMNQTFCESMANLP